MNLSKHCVSAVNHQKHNGRHARCTHLLFFTGGETFVLSGILMLNYIVLILMTSVRV